MALFGVMFDKVAHMASEHAKGLIGISTEEVVNSLIAIALRRGGSFVLAEIDAEAAIIKDRALSLVDGCRRGFFAVEDYPDELTKYLIEGSKWIGGFDLGKGPDMTAAIKSTE